MRAGRRRRADNAYRARVGRGGRKGAETNDESHVKAPGGVGDDVDEVAPVKVGLGSDEKEHVRAVTVAAVTQLNLGPGQLGRDAVDDARERAAGALIDEVLGVERGENLSRDGFEQRRDGGAGGNTRVDPALEANHEHGLAEFRVGEKNYPVVNFFIHQFSKVCFAVSASMATVSYTHLRAHETGRNLVCRL